VDTADFCPNPLEIVSTLRSVLPQFEQAGVQIAIENHDRFTVAALIDILKSLDSPMLGICLDTANSYGAQEGIRAVVEQLAPWTINLHVKDYSFRRQWHNMGYVIDGKPAGQGMLDIPWLLDHVRTTGKGSPNAIIELWPDPERLIEDTIHKEAEWAAQSVRYMRTLLDA
jgi:3-oxoisoapionate decarboxylase